MGLIEQLPSFIAGSKIDADSSSAVRISSIDGQQTLSLATTDAIQLRKALRFAESSQKKLKATSLQERMDVVKLILKTYSEHRQQVAWGLAHFRGYVARDSYLMCDLLQQFSTQVEDLVAIVFGQMSLERDVSCGSKYEGCVIHESRGESAFICSATMDGPPAVSALCHAILSGTHMIVRPSLRDTATHLLFQNLLDNGLGHYGQLVRWPSSGDDSVSLNRQLLSNVKQGIVFCANETYGKLISQIGDSSGKDYRTRIKRYGTGLPLVVVLKDADLDLAVPNIVEGARLGNGKFCLSHGPVLVARERQDELQRRLIEQAMKLKSGDLLDLATDKGKWEPSDVPGLESALRSLGGRIVFGAIHKQSTDADLAILTDLPENSPIFHQEFPGPLLGLVPFDSLDDVRRISNAGLEKNHREAWTAINVFGNSEYQEACKILNSSLFLHGSVTSIYHFLFPHQGNFFCCDLMRRTAIER